MMTLPGTTIEVSELKKNCSRALFDGIFAAGGITLSQVSIMTGLEPYHIQNWVKRGFVSSPVRRQYTKSQFARIVCINFLKDSLPLEGACRLISYLNGDLSDQSDDRIDDSELYHLFVNLLSLLPYASLDEAAVKEATSLALEDYSETVDGVKSKLFEVLQIMAWGHIASRARRTAEMQLSSLE